MRQLITTTIAVIIVAAAIGGGVALHRQAPATPQRVMMLRNL